LTAAAAEAATPTRLFLSQDTTPTDKISFSRRFYFSVTLFHSPRFLSPSSKSPNHLVSSGIKASQIKEATKETSQVIFFSNSANFCQNLWYKFVD